MGTLFLIAVLAPFILNHIPPAAASRIRIVNNGYEEILVSLPHEADAKDRAKIVSSMKSLFDESSTILSEATKGRAHFHSVTFLVPRTWGEMDSWLSPHEGISFDDAGAAHRRQDADVVVSYSTGDEHPHTLHQGGCGRQALRINLPSTFLLSREGKQSGIEFVRLWSEFRYGVFPEGGFEDDPKYPTTYQSPGDASNKTTGCNSETLKTFSQCEKHDECEDNPVKSSLMDQYQPSSDIYFCENYLNLGPRHDPNSPSKHNLLCNEEGTWFTVLRSPDFKQGRNAAPKNLSVPQVIFRYVGEVDAPRVLVAIDISSQMNKQNRYDLTKNAFSQFVTSFLPDDSELSVLLFGGDSESTLVTSNVKLVDENARTSYLESLPLPDEPLPGDNACLECALEDIVELVTNANSTFSSAPIVVLVTAENDIDDSKFDDILRKLLTTEIIINVMAFQDEVHKDSVSQSSLYDLCSKTGHKFMSLEGDHFGNLYNGFHEAVTGSRTSVLVYQEYLITLDEENIRLPFIVDKSLSQTLQVSISGPSFGTTSVLEYDKTVLLGPDGSELRPKKHELIPSLNFRIQNPKVGTYVLKTRRKYRAISPVLVSVYGTSISTEDPVSVKIWTEVTEYKISSPPIQIFAEVRKGPYPIQNVSAVAYVQHPNGYMENIPLYDDGLGSVDITQGDGIYSHYFTNFSGIGFYNVKVKVAAGAVEYYSIIAKGPSSYCCGSSFSSSEEVSTGQFQRETGVSTFRVTISPDGVDHYPPAKVTDLRVARAFSQIIALQWSAVGNDFDSGEAAAYQLKLFHDRSLIQHRFPDSGLELETIEITSPAAYGTNLYHVLQIPKFLEEGVYYFGIRALDDAGNAGKPSNAVAVWLSMKNGKAAINCTDEPIAEKINSASMNSPIAFLVIFVIFVTFFVTLPVYDFSNNYLGAI